MKKYKKKCELCGSSAFVDYHHIVPKYAGGSDDEINRVNVCPNCHRKIHAGVIFIEGWNDLKYAMQLVWEEKTRDIIPLRPGKK